MNAIIISCGNKLSHFNKFLCNLENPGYDFLKLHTSAVSVCPYFTFTC